MPEVGSHYLEVRFRNPRNSSGRIVNSEVVRTYGSVRFQVRFTTTRALGAELRPVFWIW